MLAGFLFSISCVPQIPIENYAAWRAVELIKHLIFRMKTFEFMQQQIYITMYFRVVRNESSTSWQDANRRFRGIANFSATFWSIATVLFARETHEEVARDLLGNLMNCFNGRQRFQDDYDVRDTSSNHEGTHPVRTNDVYFVHGLTRNIICMTQVGNEVIF